MIAICHVYKAQLYSRPMKAVKKFAANSGTLKSPTHISLKAVLANSMFDGVRDRVRFPIIANTTNAFVVMIMGLSTSAKATATSMALV